MTVRIFAVLVLVLGLTGPPAVSPAVEYRGWGCSVEFGDLELTDAQVDTYVAQLAACTERHWPGWWDRA